MFGRIFVILPVAHAALCYFYLYFFSIGFGHGVLELATVGDILSVGLGKILPFYLLFMASIVFTYLWMEEEPLKIESGKDTSLHPSLEVSWFGKMITFFLFAIPAIQILFLITIKKVQLLGLMIGLSGIAAILIRKAVEVNGWKKRDGLLAIFCFLGLCVVASSAYTEGFHDRTKEFGDFTREPTICGDQSRFLFAVGDYKIVVQPTGRRVAFNDECEAVLRFVPQTVTIDLL